MSDVALLVLTRHAETVWHADNRYAGARSDIDLTAAGRAQADRLARWAAGRQLAAVVASPVRRAVETARPSAAAGGYRLEVSQDLREVDFGAAEGRTLAEVSADDPEVARRFAADPVGHPFPGAEPPEDAAQRADRALRQVAARHPGAEVLVVAHNTLLRLALCSLLGIPLRHYREVLPRLDNVALTRLRVPVGAHGRCALLSLNDTLPPDASGPASTPPTDTEVPA